MIPPLLQRLGVVLVSCFFASAVLADGQVPPGAGSWLPTDDGGWTILIPSPDSRIVYVSTSSGNDGYSGLSESAPKYSIAAAYALLRHGFPDWILLKRGDSWNESLGHWRKSGRSAVEPMVVGSYGAGTIRPLLRTGVLEGLYRSGGNNSPPTVDNLAITGVAFVPHAYNGNNGTPGGFWWLGPGSNILIEDCRFEGYFTALAMIEDNGRINSVAVRRCVIIDSYGNGGHSQGIFLSGVDNLLLEENLIDHNGWKEGVCEPDIFKHNIYATGHCTGITLRRNIIARASSHGVQLRPGGVIDGNVFLRNPLGVLVGGGDPMPETHTNGVTGSVRDNVILEGTDIAPGYPRGMGIEVTNIGAAGAVIERNIIAHKLVANSQYAIAVTSGGYGSGVGARNVTIQSNVVYDWRGPLCFGAPGPGQLQQGHRVERNDFQDPFATLYSSVLVSTYGLPPGMAAFTGNRYTSGLPLYRNYLVNSTERSYSQWVSNTGETQSSWSLVNYPSPNRSVGSYNATLGRPGTFDDFMIQVRAQSRLNWRTQYTANAVATYIRAGFGVTPSQCAGDFDQNGVVNVTDAILFQSLFAVRSLGADLNHDGQWNILDFIAFQSAAAAGCP